MVSPLLNLNFPLTYEDVYFSRPEIEISLILTSLKSGNLTAVFMKFCALAMA